MEECNERMLTLRDLPLHPIPIAGPETALDEAIRLLESEPLKAVALVDDRAYMGLFTQDALESGLIPRGVDRATISVGPYAHPARVVGHPEMTVEQALSAMIRKNIDLIPVVANNSFLGVITRADLERQVAFNAAAS